MASAVKAKLPEGWMGKASRVWLALRAKSHERIVEVGVWKGRSTAVLAKHCPGTVWAVDHWEGTPEDAAQHGLYRDDLVNGGDAVYAEFRRALKKPIREGKVVPVRLRSLDAAARFTEVERRFDMVFLDGDHSYEAVREDIQAWRQLIDSGGLLCGHDYTANWPGVVQAVDEAFGAAVTIGPRSLWSITV